MACVLMQTSAHNLMVIEAGCYEKILLEKESLCNLIFRYGVLLGIEKQVLDYHLQWLRPTMKARRTGAKELLDSIHLPPLSMGVPRWLAVLSLGTSVLVSGLSWRLEERTFSLKHVCAEVAKRRGAMSFNRLREDPVPPSHLQS